MAKKGVKFSEEHKKNLSKVLKKKRIRPPSMKGKKHSEETKKKMSLARKGKRLAEESSQWKGGISQDYYRRIAFENLPHLCEFCGSLNQLRVHHKDRNRQNNDLNNLMIVCKSCHNKIHQKWRNLKPVMAGGDENVK